VYPKHRSVHFKNGNKKDCRLENLEYEEFDHDKGEFVEKVGEEVVTNLEEQKETAEETAEEKAARKAAKKLKKKLKKKKKEAKKSKNKN